MHSRLHGLCELYGPGLPRIMMLLHILQGLISQKLPKLSGHLSKHEVQPPMYAAQWILTVFTYNFPFYIGTLTTISRPVSIRGIA
jgi:hypothetical protein